MEFISEAHKAVIDGQGLLVVRQVQPRQLQVTKSTPDGKLDVNVIDEKTADSPEKGLLQALSRMPTFAAGYAGNQEWNVDLEAGFQRWRGVKPSRDLSAALTNCGFDTETKQKIMRECRKHKVDYVPRYG